MSYKAKGLVLLAALLLWPLLAGCGGGTTEKSLKVAVIQIGPIEDYGWTYEGHLGAQGMAQALSYVELSESEDVSFNDSNAVLREYAADGYDVIFCHSYDYGTAIEAVAPQYPGVVFMWATGENAAYANVGIYDGRIYEAKYLAGMTAGAMTESNKIGFVAAMPVSQVIFGIDAFAKGVASVNPDARVYVEWVNAWYNPAAEEAAAAALIDGGCDVITNHTDSYLPGQVADEKGVYYISLNSNFSRYAPHAFLTAAYCDWETAMTDIAEAVHDGTWDERANHDWWYGLADGGVKLAPFSELVPQNVRTMVEEKKAAIISGAFEVFPGMSDSDIRSIDYFEPNVVGELP